MRRRIALPGAGGFFDFAMRLIVSAVIFNVVSLILKQIFDEQEHSPGEGATVERVIEIKADQVVDA
jgi:hypothetical protein